MPPNKVAKPITLANTMRRSRVRVTSRISGPCVRELVQPDAPAELAQGGLAAAAAVRTGSV
jgi:hypothetical protein